MPFRIACPSCAAALNLKDELAGRAVKCPRCGDTVPASATAAKPPAASAFEVVEDDVPPQPPPAPVTPLKSAAVIPPPAEVIPEDDDEDVVVPRKARRGAKPAGSKRNKLIVLGMFAYWAFAIFGSFWLNYRGTNRINAPGIGLGSGDTGTGTGSATKAAPAVPQSDAVAKYNLVSVKMTRAAAEAALGPGTVLSKPEYATEISFLYSGGPAWYDAAGLNRVLVWKYGDYRVFVKLYPDTGPTAVVQARRFSTSQARSVQGEGELDDENFARDNGLPLNGPPRDDPATAVRITAQELSKAYAADPKAAMSKYGARWLTVTGAFRESEPKGDTGLTHVLDGTPPIRCRVQPYDEAGGRSFTHGREVRFKGRCVGLAKDGVIELADCRLEFGGAAPPAANIVTMMLDYSRDANTADAKYKEKSFRLNEAVVETLNDDGSVTLVSPKKTQAVYKVKVAFGPLWKERLGAVKPGDKLPLAGFCKGLMGKVIEFERAWLLSPP